MEVAKLLCKFVREANSRLKESGDRQGKEMTAPSVAKLSPWFCLEAEKQNKRRHGLKRDRLIVSAGACSSRQPY
jgi:hypothetical protein